MLRTVGVEAFWGCSALTDIYYGGSEAQWNAITIHETEDTNAPLVNATIHFNSSISEWYSLTGESPATAETTQPSETTHPAEFTFPDVPAGAWYYDAVTELSSIGGITGYPDGTFGPGKDISLSQVAAIMLRAFPMDDALEPEVLDQAVRVVTANNAEGYWAAPYVARAYMCGNSQFGISAERWEQPATREEVAVLLDRIYQAHTIAVNETYDLIDYMEGAALIGDYANGVSTSPYRACIIRLYSSGIIQGRDANGTFDPKARISRAEVAQMVVTMLHPERWKAIDWDAASDKYNADGIRLSNGVDFKGKSRIRYSTDVAYDFARDLEEEIGIQIFYLPEFTQRDGAPLFPEDFEAFPTSTAYFDAVLYELYKMKTAFDLYPDGFLKEVVAKKGSRKAEIIVSPYTQPGLTSFGLTIYDETNNIEKVDQIYYTGQGDSQYYSHEMGHFVMNAGAILNGWSATTAKWQTLSTGSASYVSTYAMQNRPEDWAETWAYLWHQTDLVMGRCGDAGMLAKVKYLTEILDKNYSTFHASEVPWADVLK